MLRTGMLSLVGTLVVFAGCASGGGGRLPVETSEREITESEVPAAALAALRELADGAPLVEFEEERRNGTICYEGEWRLPEGGEAEATVLADGTVVETEIDIAADEVPAAVRQFANERAGSNRVSYARRTLTLYEIEYVSGMHAVEVLVTPGGKELARESERAEEVDD